MSKLYVNELVPRDASVITAPNLLMPTGSVIQVVQDIGAVDPEMYTTSTSFIASGSYAKITPKYSSSKILIFVNGGFMTVNTAGNYGHIRVYRNNIDVFPHEARLGNAVMNGMVSFSAYDSPNTTSEIEYKVYIKSNNGNGVQLSNHAVQSCRVTLMEIAQ